MCQDCNWKDWLEEIASLLEDRRYSFAYSTLEGIAGWIDENCHVTENQEVAIANIRDSVPLSERLKQ